MKEMSFNAMLPPEHRRYWDVSGRQIFNPYKLPWGGMLHVLSYWLEFHQDERKPEDDWIKQVVRRLQTEPMDPDACNDDRIAVAKALAERGYL